MIEKNARNTSLNKLLHSSHIQGSALVTVLVLIAIAMVVTTAAVVVAVTSAQVSTQRTQGEQVLAVAEAGVEESLVRLVRNPNYNGGSLAVGSGTATITVSGTSPQTILSVGSIQGLERTIQATASISGTVVTLTSWQEI